MTSNFKLYKLCFFAFVIATQFGLAQETSTFKAQIALGINSPSQDGFVEGFEGQSLNFPTVNLGFQYMFKPKFGAKLDYGFNRLSNENNTTEFKINYSRIDAQLVYDASKLLSFLSSRMGTFIHAGPGFSMVKPLGNFSNNDATFLNAMVGIEFHYGLSDNLSMYFDASYINAFSKDFDPILDGFGSFNGNLLTLTVGASISLSGCYFCE